MLVIAEQATDCGLPFHRGIACREVAGVRSGEIVHPVAAGGGLEQQVVIDQFLQQPVGGTRIGAGQGGGGIGVDFRAGDQAQVAEQAPLVVAEILVRQAEDRR